MKLEVFHTLSAKRFTYYFSLTNVAYIVTRNEILTIFLKDTEAPLTFNLNEVDQETKDRLLQLIGRIERRY